MLPTLPRAPEDVARSPDRHRGPSRLANPALPRLRAADLQAGVEVPLLRHLARVGRPLVDLGAVAPSSLPTVDLMHPTQIAKLFHRAGWIEWLEDVTHGQDLVLPARRLADDGLAAWAEARERGYEGLVGKEEGFEVHRGHDAPVAQA